MRLPRVRFTVRRMMVAVAVVARTPLRRPRLRISLRASMLLVLVVSGFLWYQLTQGRWMVRREWASRRIAYHAREEAAFRELVGEAQAYIRFLAEDGVGDAAEWRKAEEKILDGFMSVVRRDLPACGPPPSQTIRNHAIARVRQAATDYAELSDYHRNLVRKYVRARDRPWEAITPDPLVPNPDHMIAPGETRFGPVPRSDDPPPE